MTAIREALRLADVDDTLDPPDDVYRTTVAAARAELDALEQERLALLHELRQANYTIEFLHGCLTDDLYSYEYPEQTLRCIARLKEITVEAPTCSAHLSGRHSEPCPVHNESFQRALARLAAVRDGQTRPMLTGKWPRDPSGSTKALDAESDAVCPCRVHGDPDGDCGERCA